MDLRRKENETSPDSDADMPLRERVRSEALDAVVRDELAPELRVVRLIGRGSVASVYLAREVALDRLVAIKVLAPQKALDETVRRRFEREARSAARISHPNVTAVYRVGRLSDGLPFLVMEYVEGRNLEDVLRAQGPLSEEEARATLRQLAAALAAAHAQEIIHRDVKPANVLREKDTGRVVLTDFGVAAIRDTGRMDTTRLTVQGQVLGDLAYVAPEHLMGEPLTELADIYSLGVLGYELLTGRGPYDADSPPSLTAAHLRGEPADLGALRQGVDPELSSLLRRCLAKKPEHRPAAGEVARSLESPRRDARALQPTTAVEAFLFELKRRRVYQVAVAYIAISVAIIGLSSDTVLLPEWAPRVIQITLIAGFPVVLVLAWIFDLRAGRITRTRDRPGDAETRSAQRWLQAVALLLSLVVAGLIGWLLL